MKYGIILLAALGLLGAASVDSSVSTAVPDRLAAMQARINEDLQAGIISSPQAALFSAGATAIKALPGGDASAAQMLDELDRDIALHDLVLSASEDGMLVVAHAGQYVTVAMHDDRQWTFTVSDTSVLALPKIGVMWIRGVQGTFGALKPGSATITLEGRNPQLAGQMHATNVRIVHFYIDVIP